MSKKWKIAFSLACAAIATVAFGACGGEVTDDDSGKYEYCYRQEFTDKHDDDMKIDGVLDEARWQDSLGAKLYHGDDGITAEYTTAFSEYGVYVAATVYDPAIIWRGRYDLDQYVGSNSGFTFYIHLKDVESTQSNKLMKFETDAFGQRSYSQQHFEANTTVSGEVNGKTESMTTEMFVSWRALGLSGLEKIDADDIPEYVAIEPLYRHITLSGGNYIRSMVYPTFTEPDFLSYYPKFGKSGYLAADKDDSAIESGKRLGAAMAGHRLAKTGNWNMDNYLDEGLVISGGKGLSEVLFFKDVYAENFYAETYIDVSATNGKVGLTAQTSFNKFRAVYLHAGSLKGDSPAYNVNSLTYHPDRKYHETYGTRDKYTAYDSTEPVHFEMIKRGDSIFAFVNGTLMYADSQSWYGGEYAPGLYATEADAAFVNSYATALTATEADEKLAERNASRVTLDYNRRSGGTVTTDKLALDTKDNLSLGVEAPVGYVVGSFSINGEDKTEDYVVSARDGKYVPSYLADADGTNPLISKTGNTVAAVEFTAVTDIEGNPAKGKTYSLGVKADGAAVSGAKVTLTNVDYPSVAYTVTTSSSGEANFADIAAKDFAIFVKADGTKLVISGAYDVTVTANGYLPITKRITADENFGENGILSEIVSLDRAAIGGSTALGSKVYESDLSGWTIGGSAETGTTAHLSENSGSKRVMFGDKKSTAAVIDFTYINNAPSTEDGSTYRYYDQYIGIGAALVNDSLGDGFGMVVVGGQVRTFRNLVWSDSTSEAHSVGYSYLFNTSSASLRGKEVKMRYVHVGKTFAAYVYDSEASAWRFLYAECNNAFANESAYAMYSTSLGRVDVDLKNVSIIVGAEAESFIAENHPYALAAPIGTNLDKVTIEKTSGEEYGIGAELEYTVTADDGYYIRNVTAENATLTSSHNADGTEWNITLVVGGTGNVVVNIGAAADGIVGGFATIGETTYASYPGYDYSAYETDGTINVVDGTDYKHIYFNGVCEDTAVIDFTINNVSADYLCVGALVRTTSGSYGIGFAGGNVMDMPEGAWNNNQKSYNGSHLMWNNGQVKNSDVSFRYVKTGSKLLAFIKVGSSWSLASVVDNAVLGGNAIYAIYNFGNPNYVIKNVSIKTGAEAETEIAAAHSCTITTNCDSHIKASPSWGSGKVLIGETVSITLTPDSGYAIKNITSSLKTSPSVEIVDGTVQKITLTASSDVTFTVTEMSADKYLQPIRLSNAVTASGFPEGYANKEIASNYYYAGVVWKGTAVPSTGDNWGESLIKFKPIRSDFSEYKYLDYVINSFADSQIRLLLHYTADGNEYAYRMSRLDKEGKYRASEMTYTKVDGTTGNTTGSDWLGAKIPNVGLAVYRLDLTSSLYASDSTASDTGTSGTDGIGYNDIKASLGNVSALSVNIRSYTGYNLQICNVYGVKEDGTRELLFNAGEANFLGEQTTANKATVKLENANDVLYKTTMGNSTGLDITYTGSSGYRGIADSFAWMSMNDKNTEIVSLVGYDALTFDIDTTAMTADNLPITVRIGNDDYGKKARAVYAYIVDSVGNVTTIGDGSSELLDIPKGTKGKFVVLLRDFTKPESGGGNITNLVSAVDNGVFRFVVGNGTANYLSGQQFDIRNVCFVTDGQTLIG